MADLKIHTDPAGNRSGTDSSGCSASFILSGEVSGICGERGKRLEGDSGERKCKLAVSRCFSESRMERRETADCILSVWNPGKPDSGKAQIKKCSKSSGDRKERKNSKSCKKNESGKNSENGA